MTGYLGNAQGELGMGKAGNDVGGVFRGPALEGKRSVEEEMKMDAAGAARFWARRAFYRGVDQYDAVLRKHFRLDE